MTDETPNGGGESSRAGVKPENLLDPFLGLLERFIETYTDNVRRTLGDQDASEIADTLSQALRHQVRELGSFMREGLPRMHAQSTREMNQVLRMQGGDILLRGAIQAASTPLSAEKVLGLDGIIHEIKKILGKLLNIIWPNKPTWFDEFFVLLDEILNLLASLLFPKLKTALHKSEVQFLREIYELRKLEQLQQRADTNGDDEDDF